MLNQHRAREKSDTPNGLDLKSPKSYAEPQKCRKGVAPPELNAWDRHLLFLAIWHSFIWPQIVVFGNSILPMWRRAGRQTVSGSYIWEVRFQGL